MGEQRQVEWDALFNPDQSANYDWLAGFDLQQNPMRDLNHTNIHEGAHQSVPGHETGYSSHLQTRTSTPFLSGTGNGPAHQAPSPPFGFAPLDMNQFNTDLPQSNEESNTVFKTTQNPPARVMDPLDMSALLETAAQEAQDKAPGTPTHRLPRKRSKYLIRRSSSGIKPIPIPNASSEGEEGQSLALQRWQDSPPEMEGASLSAIYNALNVSEHLALHENHTPNPAAFRRYRGPSSTASRESVASSSSMQSATSSRSNTSQAAHPRRTRRPAKGSQKNMSAPDRIFKCTFCCDTFKHKYDWSRHEKSLHLSLEEWQCTPHGGTVLLPMTNRVHCAYCNLLDPTPQHLEEHNHFTCQTSPYTFKRKDHLVQHLRLFHRLETLPLIDDWKIETTPVTSRCGFCDAALHSWAERTDHLAAHFRNGKTMSEWRGEHGFTPEVASRVNHAIAPYLIAFESLAFVPFSVTNPATRDHLNQISSHADRLHESNASHNNPSRLQSSVDMLNTSTNMNTSKSTQEEQSLPPQQEVDTFVFTEILTRHLSRFARQQIALGIVPTDEMFQRESRRVIFDDNDDDSWNQTVADNPGWLAEFRQRNGWNSLSNN